MHWLSLQRCLDHKEQAINSGESTQTEYRNKQWVNLMSSQKHVRAVHRICRAILCGSLAFYLLCTYITLGPKQHLRTV